MPPTLSPPPPVQTPAPPSVRTPVRRFDNNAELLDALGGVPPSRVIFDPLPGTATEADLLRFVEVDKRLCELIDGTLVEKPVGYWEARIGLRLGGKIENWAEANDAGAASGADSTLRMKGGNIRLPDVCFIVNERLPKTLAAVPTLGPDLAVEILSESNTPKEMAKKLVEYFASGTRLAWYINLKTRTVAVYHAPGEPAFTLTESDTLDGEGVLPGFSLPVSELFRNVPTG